MSKIGEPLGPLLGVLGDLVTWLHAGQIRGALIGGVAASLLGRPRVTRGIDILVILEECRWEEFATEGKQYGFVLRKEDAMAFARTARVLLVRHKASGIDVDVVFGTLPFEEEVVDRAMWVEVSGISLPVSRAEDLIIMKSVAGRPRDIADVESILDACPDLDRAHTAMGPGIFERA